MRIQSSGIPLLLSALLQSFAAAATFDCAHINVDKHKYDLSALGGVHEISHVLHENSTTPTTTNTTYVLNICNVLGKAANRPEGKCGMSKNVCGFVRETPEDGNGISQWGYPIAGLEPLGHGTKDPEFTRLSEIDENKQGLRIKMTGGEYRSGIDAKTKKAGAIIDFTCDPDRSGLEGVRTTEDEPVDGKRRRDEEKAPAASLQFKSFGPDADDLYTLKLDWRTRYACDDYQRGKSDGSSHWGFFTWALIIIFLSIAAYLIFGSWLNYNRYGARGWDLLPHGDTIRDIPYLMQDWIRRVVNTLQGSGGSRGGYSAV